MSLTGKTICFAGTFKSYTHASASALAKKSGAIVINSVTDDLNILVAGCRGASKSKKASEKGVAIWTEEQFDSVVAELTGSKKTAPSPPKSPKKAKADDEPADAPTPKKARKQPTTPKTPPPKKSATATKPAPATPAAFGSKARRVMSIVNNSNQQYSVYQD